MKYLIATALLIASFNSTAYVTDNLNMDEWVSCADTQAVLMMIGYINQQNTVSPTDMRKIVTNKIRQSCGPMPTSNN